VLVVRSDLIIATTKKRLSLCCFDPSAKASIQHHETTAANFETTHSGIGTMLTFRLAH
jgi:hypothetical protein